MTTLSSGFKGSLARLPPRAIRQDEKNPQAKAVGAERITERLFSEHERLFPFFQRMGAFMGKSKQTVASIIAIVIVLGFSAKALLTQRSEGASKKKIVVLGIDALDPLIIERLIQAGKLPRFARLKGTGSYSRLSTTNPPQSPVAWAAFATGKNPGKNGVFDFIKRDPATYGLELVFAGKNGKAPAGILKEKGFWDYASEKKIPLVMLSCPDTFPPNKIHGKMLSGMGVPDILGTQGTFTFYTSEPARKDRSVGGKVVQVPKAPVIEEAFLGPRKTGADGKPWNVRVLFRLTLLDKEHARVEYQGRKTELAVGQWSDWNRVVFDLGFFRKASGIFKFYLVSVEPEIKLYVSPINFDPKHPFFPISYPEKYAGQLAKEIGLYYTQGMPMDTWALNEDRLLEEAFLRQAEEVFKERRAMFDLELKRLRNGILFCYFENIDIVQHMFWRYMDPEHPSYKKGAERRGEIDKWYGKMDEILGDVFAKLGPEDTLIVLSDHGFESFRRAVHLNSWLREMGYLSLKEGIKNATERELFAAVDWEKTQAYAVGFGGIYINQRGREGRGTVAPGEETEALKSKIGEELGAWTDEQSDEPIVRNVYKREEIFRGPYAEEAPDLYVGFNPGYRASWQTAIGGVPAKKVENNLKKWSGDHLFDFETVPGVIFSNRKILRRDPAIYDLAPSILKEAGMSDEEIKEYGFDGKTLF